MYSGVHHKFTENASARKGVRVCALMALVKLRYGGLHPEYDPLDSQVIYKVQ